MGLAASKENQSLKKKNKKYYAPPYMRLRTRFDSIDNSTFITAAEASIDKFDYVLAFPLVKGVFSKGLEEDDTEVFWEEMKYVWMKSVPGTNEAKEASANEMADYFTKRTKIDPRDEKNHISRKKWLSVAREKILETLAMSGGMQLKVSAYRSYILVRMRCPIKLLESQADAENYWLQFRPEIDPGSKEFWNVEVDGVAVEIVEEKKIYSQEEATDILEKLYRAGKIQANDRGVNPKKEIPKGWSRRVHALERIADKVLVTNKFPAYAPFSISRELRYLFNEYPNVRGRSLFRYKDRIYLTKAIIDLCFDFRVLEEYEVVEGCFALHDANRGDPITIDVLQRRWVLFWRGAATEVGSPFVSDDAMENDEGVWFYNRPWAQPLNHIRDYFGDKIGLYFAWLGFYSYFLIVPAVLGAVMEVIFWVRGYEDGVDQVDYYLSTFNVLIVMWNAWYKQSWKRENFAISLKWGTKNAEEAQKDRPQFYGISEEPLKRSVIDNELKTNFPDERRLNFVILSNVVVFLLMAANVAVIGGVFFAEYLVINVYTEYYFNGFVWWSSLIQAVQIPISQYLFKQASTALNDLENYRTEIDYEDSLIKKNLFFQLFNAYGALIFDAFGRGPLLNTCTSSCFGDLRILLYAIVIVRTGLNVFQIVIPFVYIELMSLLNKFFDFMEKDPDAAAKQELTAETLAEMQFTEEILRVSYEGTFDDYAEAVIQYGYICLFSVAMPLMGPIALGENLLKIRSDAYRMCALTRRPDVVIAEDVGLWEFLMDIMSLIGIVIGVGIICFTGETFDEYSFVTIAIIFLVYEQLLFLIKYFVEYLLPAQPKSLQLISDRQDFIFAKFFEGNEQDDDELDTSAMKDSVDDTIDVDTLNLSELRDHKQFMRDVWVREKQMLVDLEAQRRNIQKELRTAKENLEHAYRYEKFNVKTGVGENFEGIPIARLQVKVCEIMLTAPETHLLTKDTGLFDPRTRVHVAFRPYTKGVAVGPHDGRHAYTEHGQITKMAPTTILFNDDMIFAPLRTADADVVFEIMHTPKEGRERVIYTASISLRDLMDQQMAYKVLLLLPQKDPYASKSTTSEIHVQVQFQFSKVVPLRALMASWKSKLNDVERQLAKIKAGRVDFLKLMMEEADAKARGELAGDIGV